jgi:hypothetical protein
MGFYINQNSKGKTIPALNKAAALIEDGAELLTKEPETWEEGLICVVSNGLFEAAAYAFSPQEMNAFKDPDDYRPRVWLKWDKAKELAK